MNLFDSANYPVKEPTQLVIGDRWTWKRSDLGADYSPSSYTLKYTLRKEGDGATDIDITASGSGSDYVVEVAAATTAAKSVGTYHWQAYITRTSDSERITVDSGYMELLNNRDADTSDPRTHAQIMLDLYEAALQALKAGVKSYTIQGRVMTYRDIGELETNRDKYKAEVSAEQQALNNTGKLKLKYRL
jgi:hypothetical protein